MEFQFARFTEITDYAHKHNPTYREYNYTRIFICPDVWDFWLCRILPDTNKDYEPENGSFLLERNKIDMDVKGESLTLKKLKEIIEEDDFSNWDYNQAYSEKELIEMLDDGFGILNLKK